MPIQTILEHPAFFGTILGAVAGWAGSWGAMRLTIQHLVNDLDALKERLECVEERQMNRRDECARVHERLDERVLSEIRIIRGLLDESEQRSKKNVENIAQLKGVVETYIKLRGEIV